MLTVLLYGTWMLSLFALRISACLVSMETSCTASRRPLGIDRFRYKGMRRFERTLSGARDCPGPRGFAALNRPLTYPVVFLYEVLDVRHAEKKKNSLAV